MWFLYICAPLHPWMANLLHPQLPPAAWSSTFHVSSNIVKMHPKFHFNFHQITILALTLCVIHFPSNDAKFFQMTKISHTWKISLDSHHTIVFTDVLLVHKQRSCLARRVSVTNYHLRDLWQRIHDYFLSCLNRYIVMKTARLLQGVFMDLQHWISRHFHYDILRHIIEEHWFPQERR